MSRSSRGYRVSGQDGFTLPELLLTAAILAFCLSSILSSFINSSALNEAARNIVSATAHADFVMESIRNTPFSSIPSNMGGAEWSTWTLDEAQINGKEGLSALKGEKITTTLTGVNPLDVTVNVAWVDAGGRARSKAIRTLISE